MDIHIIRTSECDVDQIGGYKVVDGIIQIVVGRDAPDTEVDWLTAFALSREVETPPDN